MPIFKNFYITAVRCLELKNKNFDIDWIQAGPIRVILSNFVAVA